jgi:hypothetical protein
MIGKAFWTRSGVAWNAVRTAWRMAGGVEPLALSGSHCFRNSRCIPGSITILLNWASVWLVPAEGVEPSRLPAAVFEAAASPGSARPARYWNGRPDSNWCEISLPGLQPGAFGRLATPTLKREHSHPRFSRHPDEVLPEGRRGRVFSVSGALGRMRAVFTGLQIRRITINASRARRIAPAGRRRAG